MITKSAAEFIAERNARPLFVTNVWTLYTPQGNEWKILGTNRPPDGFTKYADPTFRTFGLALGWIKRHVKQGGAATAFAIFNDGWNGATAWAVYAGDIADLRAAAAVAQTVSSPVRESLWALAGRQS